MNEQRESFVFYRGFRDAINALPEEYQLKTVKYLMDYALDGTEPEENGIEAALFISFKPQIDAAKKRYETVVKNGQKGGRPKKKNQNKTENNQQPEKQNLNKTENNQQLEIKNQSESKNNQELKIENQEKPKSNLNDNDNVNDNVNPPKGEVQKGESVPPNPLGDKHKNDIKQELKKIRDSFVFPSTLQKKVNDWLMYKKEKRQPYKPKGLQSLLSQIKNNCSTYGEQAVVDIIDMSMANNYEGILWAKIGERKGGTSYAGNYGNYGANGLSNSSQPNAAKRYDGDVL